LEEIAARPEDDAAQLVRALDEDDPEWLNVFVSAFADERPEVAAAGQARLVDLVESWESLPPQHISARVSAVAGYLAACAPRLQPERLAVAQSLAHRLLAWPVDSRQVDAARLIANCEAILDLPQRETTEVEVAAAPLNAPAEVVEDAAGSPSDEPQRLARPPAIRISDR
jgi:hypothetical protein